MYWQANANTPATQAATYPGPSGPEIAEKSQKVCLGVSRKVPENTRNSFRIFSPFSDFFAISAAEGPETPVNGGSGRKGIRISVTPLLNLPGLPRPKTRENGKTCPKHPPS